MRMWRPSQKKIENSDAHATRLPTSVRINGKFYFFLLFLFIGTNTIVFKWENASESMTTASIDTNGDDRANEKECKEISLVEDDDAVTSMATTIRHLNHKKRNSHIVFTPWKGMEMTEQSRAFILAKRNNDKVKMNMSKTYCLFTVFSLFFCKFKIETEK